MVSENVRLMTAALRYVGAPGFASVIERFASGPAFAPGDEEALLREGLDIFAGLVVLRKRPEWTFTTDPTAEGADDAL